MKITKNNYEAFLLDYIEGNLSAEIAAELMLFLENNPELNVDLNDFNLISANENESIIFNDKQKLKRKEFVINDDVIESLIISLINGDLLQDEESKLLKVIEHDDNYKKLYHQYLNTILANEETEFENKFLLKGHLPITNENVEYFLIAELEGILKPNEKIALEKFKVKYLGIKSMTASYVATKLDKNEFVVFNDKKSLRKKETVTLSFYSIARYASIAAAACLILYFSFFNSTSDTSDINFAFAPTFKNNAAGEEKLIANQIDKVNDNTNTVAEENDKEKKLISTPDLSNQKKMLVSNKPEKQIKQKPILKEPVLDMANEKPFIHHEEEENPVLFAKEEINEIPNQDNNTLASVNTNLASINEDDYISPGQYVRNWAKKTFFTDQATEKYNSENSELADNTLQLKGTDLKVKNTKSENYKEYGFSIGKFSFNRKVKK